MTQNGAVSPKQRAVIELMLTPISISEVSRQSGVSRRQLHRWLTDDTFNTALQRAQTEASKRAIAIVAGALIDGARTAAHLAQLSEDESVRLRAAQVVLDFFERLHARVEIVERLERLEAVR